jgi:two-component system chemotaxis response regulator CheY
LVETIVGLLRLLPGKTVATGFADHQLGLTLKLDAETMATLEPYLQVGSDYTPFARPVAASATETPINAHILIVEDTLVSRLMLRRTLEQIPGCTVSETSTGREALAFMQKNGPPDLCISDIAMPDMDGLTLLKEIRANPSLSHLEVMLCTASTERETILRAVELNVTRYLVKPFEPAQVKTQVRETLVQAAAREFRKLEELQQRVGLDPAGTVEVLRGLSQQLGKDVSAVRNALASGKRHGANMILQGLRGSCSSIKEHALVTRIDNLLVELDRGDLTATLDGLDLLSSEGKRVGQIRPRAHQPGPGPRRWPKLTRHQTAKAMPWRARGAADFYPGFTVPPQVRRRLGRSCLVGTSNHSNGSISWNSKPSLSLHPAEGPRLPRAMAMSAPIGPRRKRAQPGPPIRWWKCRPCAQSAPPRRLPRP